MTTGPNELKLFALLVTTPPALTTRVLSGMVVALPRKSAPLIRSVPPELTTMLRATCGLPSELLTGLLTLLLRLAMRVPELTITSPVKLLPPARLTVFGPVTTTLLAFVRLLRMSALMVMFALAADRTI